MTEVTARGGGSEPRRLGDAVEAWRRLDPSAEDIRRDPVALFHRLQEEDPLHRLATGQILLTRRADVDLAGRSQAFTREGMASGGNADESPWERLLHGNFQFHDPPEHTRMRNLAQRPFSAKGVAAWRPRFEELVGRQLDEMYERGTMDVVADFAHPLPVTIITELLGVPAEMREIFEEITEILLELFVPGDKAPDLFTRADAVAERFIEQMGAVVDHRRANPGDDDLLTQLIAATEGGDRLTRDELIGTAMLLHVAGHETTGNLIANGVLTLLHHPAQLQLLREDPSLIRSAVEEILRYEPSAITAAPALAASPVELPSGVVPEGVVVQPITAAGCRDPRAFEEPDVFDIRRLGQPHIAFYSGTHFCMGAMLSRAETQVALDMLFRRFSDIELDTAEPEWRRVWSIRALERLPVHWSVG